MIKLIRRITDNKYLQSIDNDIWVDDVKEAYEMTYRECNDAKNSLLNTYQGEQLKEIVDLNKHKAISGEEKAELLALLKK